MGRADPALAHRARCSSGGQRNLPAVVCPVLQLERKRRHQLRLRLVRAVHDDGDARLRRLLRAESLVSGIRQRPKRRRKPASGETELGPLAHRSAFRALLALLGRLFWRLLEQLVDSRLEHVAELLVERVAEIAAGAGRGRLLRIGGGARRLRGGRRAAGAGARLRRGRLRATAVAGARGGARAAAALAGGRLLLGAPAGGRLLLGAPAARRLAGIALGLGLRARLCFLAPGRRARLVVVVVVARPGGGRGLDRLRGLLPIPVVGRRALLLLLLRLVLEEQRQEEERLRGARDRKSVV